MAGRTASPRHQRLPQSASQTLLEAMDVSRSLRRTTGERRRALHASQLLHEEVEIPRGTGGCLIISLFSQQLGLGGITAWGWQTPAAELFVPERHPLADLAQAKPVDGDMVHRDKPGPLPVGKAVEGGGKERALGQIEGGRQQGFHLCQRGCERLGLTAQIPLCHLPTGGVGLHEGALPRCHKGAVQTGDLIERLTHRPDEVMRGERPLQQPVLSRVASRTLRVFLLGKPDARLRRGEWPARLVPALVLGTHRHCLFHGNILAQHRPGSVFASPNA